MEMNLVFITYTNFLIPISL